MFQKLSKTLRCLIIASLIPAILSMSAVAIAATSSSSAPTNSSAPEEKKDVNNKGKTFKIYIVLWATKDALVKGFMDYMERQKIKAEYTLRYCDQNKEKCHDFVKEIRDIKPDLIFTWGTPACEAIAGTIDAPNKQDYIWDIPMISLIVTDPIKSKLIYDMKKTGRNITGVNHVAPISSHIEAMKSYLKDLKKVATLYNPAETNSGIMVKELQKIGPDFELEVSDHPIPVDENGQPIVEKIEEEVEKIAKEGAQFIYIPAESFLSINIKHVMDVANKHKLLTIGTTEYTFFFGPRPLMGLLSRFYDVGLFGGFKAEQILIHGEKPENIPYEKLKTFSLLLAPEVFRNIKVYPPLSMIKYAEILPELNSDKNIERNNNDS